MTNQRDNPNQFKPPTLAIIAAAGAAVVVILHLINLPWNSTLAQEIENAGHMPMFGLFSLLILAVVKRLLSSRLRSPSTIFVISFVLASLAGLGMEFLQKFVARDPDIRDLFRDMMGAGAFLLLAATYEKVSSRPLVSRLWTKFFLRIAAVMILLAGTIPLGHAIGGYFHRSEKFPQLCDFISIWERPFLRVRYGSITANSAPVEWPGERPQQIAKLDLRPGVYAGVMLEEVSPDWRGYAILALDIYCESPPGIDLVIRIDDVHHRGRLNDRFNRTIHLSQGFNPMRLLLSEIEAAPAGRRMDMENLYSVILFVPTLEKPATLYLGPLRLIK